MNRDRNEGNMQKINLKEKLSLVNEYWSPKIVGELNDSHVKIAKLKGEFVWHKHDNKDEMFFIIKGKLLIKLREKDIHLQEGEFVIIPKGVEHLPIADEEVHVMLIEPKTTLNTGDVVSDLTKNTLDHI
jgi:mannose-6-phosphate isomerase-like protein (cupin superfamily)